MRIVAVLLALGVMVPVWARADCSGGAVSTGRSCGDVSFAGCCDGEKLLFCEAGEICEKNCEAFKHCGFSSEKGFYDCGTDGMPDPAGGFGMTCPSDPCQGVGYDGCCAGTTVLWCEKGNIRSMDCSTNGKKKSCGMSQETPGAVDCVLPGEPAGPACGSTGGLDIVVGDGSGPGDVSSPEADVAIDYDALLVPEMNSPTECAELTRYWSVETTTCPAFGSSAQAKESSCVAVWAGLVPTATGHPYGRVTVSGIQFEFTEAGVKNKCSGQFAGEQIQGQCFWGDSQCVFTLVPASGPAPSNPDGSEPGKGKSSGGCASGPTSSRTGMLLLAAALVAVMGLVRGPNRGARRYL